MPYLKAVHAVAIARNVRLVLGAVGKAPVVPMAHPCGSFRWVVCNDISLVVASIRCRGEHNLVTYACACASDVAGTRASGTAQKQDLHDAPDTEHLALLTAARPKPGHA